MIPDKYKLLIQKLNEKTTANEIIWTKTSREDEFQVILSKGAITTDHWKDSDGASYVDFVIMNERGERIDSLNFHESDIEDYGTLLTLNRTAYRSYFKIQETLDSIYNELNSNKIVGKESKPEDLLPF